MRRVELKIVEFKGVNDEPLPNLHYSEALMLISRTPVQMGAGLNTEEMKPSLAVQDAIKNACDPPGLGRDVFLEEADWNWLVERLKANRFPYASHVFMDMVEAVMAAPKVDPHQLNGGAQSARNQAVEGPIAEGVLASRVTVEA